MPSSRLILVCLSSSTFLLSLILRSQVERFFFLVSAKGTSDSATTPPPPPPCYPSPFLLCSGCLSASAKHSTPSWSLAPGSLLSLLLCRSVAAWKERRVATDETGGRSQRGGRHLSLPLIALSICSSHLQGVADSVRALRFKILFLEKCLIWLHSASHQSLPSSSYSAAVSPRFLLFASLNFCSFFSCNVLIWWLISTSFSLHLPIFSRLLRFVRSLCLSEVRRTVLCICCVSFCAAYQISHKAPMLFLIALPMFSNPPIDSSVKATWNQTWNLFFMFLKATKLSVWVHNNLLRTL